MREREEEGEREREREGERGREKNSRLNCCVIDPLRGLLFMESSKYHWSTNVVVLISVSAPELS